MKLAFIEIAGFRGFKNKARLAFQSGFAVLTGRNGAGKSTVFDALDFVLTGSINKYAVTSAKGGGLDDHIWWVGGGKPKEEYVAVGFITDDGEEFVITRSRERGLDVAMGEIAKRLYMGKPALSTWAETLVQTTLIRDETIAALSLDLPGHGRFTAVRDAISGLVTPGHTARIDALSKAASDAQVIQQRRVTDVQAELSRSLSGLTEARSLADKQADIAEAERIIATLAPDVTGTSRERAEPLRRRIAEMKQSILVVTAAIADAEKLRNEQLELESEATVAEIAELRVERLATLDTLARAQANLEEALRAEAVERQNDAFVADMVALLNHGETLGLQSGHCPLCDASRSARDFARAIATARSKLKEQGERVAMVTKLLEDARRAADDAAKALYAIEQHLKVLDERRNGVLQAIEAVSTTFRRWNFRASPADSAYARQLIQQRQEDASRLERALFVLESSGAYDRVVALEGRVGQLRAQVDEESAKLSSAERAGDTVKQIDNAAKEISNQVLQENFDTVLPLLKELYQRLRPHADWREIGIDFGGRVRASLNFVVGDGRNPQFVFSSGQRRVTGLAFLLAIHLSRSWCRLHSLLLDDPVQHIDDYRAMNLIEVLSAVRRTGRQVIIAVEDPDLADVLCRRLRCRATESGTRFEMGVAEDGSNVVKREVEIMPLPHETLRVASG